jgi:hypothetical protein
MRSMQCNVEFGHQLSICSGTKENPDPVGVCVWSLQRRRNVFPVRYGLYLCVPYGSPNKQRLFPQTALTGWALYRRHNVFPVRYGLNVVYC